MPRSRLDERAFSKNAIRSDPAIDSTAIIADLESLTPDGLHDVKVFSTPHLAEHDVSNRESGTSTGATVQRWPDSIRPFIDAPRGRKEKVSPARGFSMECVAHPMHTMLSPHVGQVVSTHNKTPLNAAIDPT